MRRAPPTPCLLFEEKEAVIPLTGFAAPERLTPSGMAISGLPALFLLLVRTPLQVGVVYLFAGVGLACFSPSMMSYVGDVSPPHFLGRAYGWYTSSLFLGMAGGPGLGGAIADGCCGTRV